MTQEVNDALSLFILKCLEQKDTSWHKDLFFHIVRYRAFSIITEEEREELSIIFPWQELLPEFQKYMDSPKLESGCTY